MFEVYDAPTARAVTPSSCACRKDHPSFRRRGAAACRPGSDSDGPSQGAGKLSYAETSPTDRASQLSEVEFEEEQSSYGDLLKDLKVRSKRCF